VAITSPSRALRALKDILNDPLYRGALFLLANTVATSAIGFVFWTLAAHRYSASAIGVFSSVTSGAGLLATIAALGLPITMSRHGEADTMCRRPHRTRPPPLYSLEYGESLRFGKPVLIMKTADKPRLVVTHFSREHPDAAIR
jgi:hypothetical protein